MKNSYYEVNEGAEKKRKNLNRAAGDPLYNNDCIYTPDMMVFKSDTDRPERLSEKDWYKVNVVTCAAPNLRRHKEGGGSRITDRQLLGLHEKRIRRILDVALRNGNEAVILGAFGCGAFANLPHIVAQAMKNVVKEYRHALVEVEFAVYCRPGEDENYRVFKNSLQGL